MVRVPYNSISKSQLNLDFGAHPPSKFKQIGLSLGETFTNSEGTELRVSKTPSGNKWYLEAVDGKTKPEKAVTTILSDLPYGDQFVEEYTPDDIAWDYRLDFALQSLKYAIEPHGDYWWLKTPGSESEKTANLMNNGWDILWLPASTIANNEFEIRKAIEAQLTEIVSERLTVYPEDTHIHFEKVMPHDARTITYRFPKTEISTEVYEGREIPATVGYIERWR